ncbi:hypothetical protein J6590_004581 [Homalodisca vitripennis]|nr:hypothetical protein J6590_004581 [Homalodisca vitripennis]
MTQLKVIRLLKVGPSSNCGTKPSLAAHNAVASVAACSVALYLGQLPQSTLPHTPSETSGTRSILHLQLMAHTSYGQYSLLSKNKVGQGDKFLLLIECGKPDWSRKVVTGSRPRSLPQPPVWQTSLLPHQCIRSVSIGVVIF